MARGELYLTSYDGSIKLNLIQMITASVQTMGATWASTPVAYGGVGNITRTLTKTPVVIPVPNQEPIGFDMNMIEADTIRINTTWYDGLNGTYASAENFFYKRTFPIGQKQYPYHLIMGEKEYWVMLQNWTADLNGGHGDTIPVSISLTIVATPSA